MLTKEPAVNVTHDAYSRAVDDLLDDYATGAIGEQELEESLTVLRLERDNYFAVGR